MIYPAEPYTLDEAFDQVKEETESLIKDLQWQKKTVDERKIAEEVLGEQIQIIIKRGIEDFVRKYQREQNKTHKMLASLKDCICLFGSILLLLAILLGIAFCLSIPLCSY